MSIFETSIWRAIKKNRILYLIIHNTVGKVIGRFHLKKRIHAVSKEGITSILDIDNALSSTGCIFYLDFGTLLGITRDGNLLKWDYDLDYGIHITEQFNWIDLENCLNSIGFTLVKYFQYAGVTTEQTYKRNNIYVDFFNHFSDGENSYYYVYYHKKNKHYDDDNQLNVRKTTTHLIEGNDYLESNGYAFRIPCNHQYYLEEIYGKDWMIPNESWTPDNMNNIEYLPGLGILTII